jgi:UDP-glucose 6-dehydrogenase
MRFGTAVHRLMLCRNFVKKPDVNEVAKAIRMDSRIGSKLKASTVGLEVLVFQKTF